MGEFLVYPKLLPDWGGRHKMQGPAASSTIDHVELEKKQNK
jgi:hypothetical protein